jgi:hypothetical protein
MSRRRELASRERSVGGRAFLAVEERDLAEQQVGEDHLLSARPGQRHAHRAVEDHQHALARRADMKDRFANIKALAAGMAGEFVARASLSIAQTSS